MYIYLFFIYREREINLNVHQLINSRPHLGNQLSKSTSCIKRLSFCEGTACWPPAVTWSKLDNKITTEPSLWLLSKPHPQKKTVTCSARETTLDELMLFFIKDLKMFYEGKKYSRCLSLKDTCSFYFIYVYVSEKHYP